MKIPEHLKSKRLRRGDLGSIEQEEFADIVLELLHMLGGRARRQIVLNYIHQIFGTQFKEPDYELLKSQNPPKERWIHNVDWAKRKLVEKGLLFKPSDSPYGTWVLTENNDVISRK